LPTLLDELGTAAFSRAAHCGILIPAYAKQTNLNPLLIQVKSKQELINLVLELDMVSGVTPTKDGSPVS